MISYIRPIDPHVHLRGTEYPNHNFLDLGFRDAQNVGLAAMLEQPNPTPWLTNTEAIEKRLFQASIYTYPFDIIHGIHIGLTNNLEQVRSALESVMERKNGLISDKTFYVHSTGNMGILDSDFQRKIWELKGKMNYRGVSIGHFEDEKYFIGSFDHLKPESHSNRQNPISELVQVENQIRNARDMKFQGIFYIAHVSGVQTIEYIEREKAKLPFEVIKEITFHHMFLNSDDDYEIHGNRVKMNPPIRSRKTQEKLLEYVLAGKFDVIGTDHAPHPLERKDSNEPPSGIPALPFWPKGIELLRKEGIDEYLLEKLIFHNANKIFKLGLTPRRIDAEYNPALWDAYGYNPFSRIDK